MKAASHKVQNILLWFLLGLIDVYCRQSDIQIEKCRNYARHIATYSQGKSQLPPDVLGEWTSSTCEVFPGPQFILRKLHVVSSRRWNARFHHYSDGWCNNPTFTVSVSGKYKLKGESDRTKGAYVSEFEFQHMVLTPHSVQALVNILSVAERFCPSAGLPVLERQKDGKVMAPDMRNYTLGKDAYRKRECRELLGLHFYAYRLVKVISHFKRSHLEDQLYFGEVPTHRARKTFIPSAFQFPLLRASSPSCSICRLIRSSSANFPPALSQERRIGTIKGNWVSKNCEVQSDMFLSRFLRFYGDPFQNERKWELNYYYFSDTNCKTLSYIISASGNYSKDKPSSVIDGASNYAFTLTNLKITPAEKLIVTLLKSSPQGTCGVEAEWRVNEEQDVTATKGCRAFELYLPSTEHDILKVSRRADGGLELFTGQRPTDDSSLNDEKNRPRSFQLPLRTCSDVTRDVHPLTTELPTERPSIGIDVVGFTIPIDLLPTKATGNEVEFPESNRNVKYDPGNSSRRVCSSIWLTLISTLLVVIVLSR